MLYQGVHMDVATGSVTAEVFYHGISAVVGDILH
jgi:hypothetical protein